MQTKRRAAIEKQNSADGSTDISCPVSKPDRNRHTQAVSAMFASKESHCRAIFAAMCFFAPGTI